MNSTTKKRKRPVASELSSLPVSYTNTVIMMLLFSSSGSATAAFTWYPQGNPPFAKINTQYTRNDYKHPLPSPPLTSSSLIFTTSTDTAAETRNSYTSSTKDEIIRHEMEIVTYPASDKIESSDLIKGSIDITNIEEGDSLIFDHPIRNGKNGHEFPVLNGKNGHQAPSSPVLVGKEEEKKQEKTKVSSKRRQSRFKWRRRRQAAKMMRKRLLRTEKVSQLFDKAKQYVNDKKEKNGFTYARTVSGLITALAEEADNLQVEVDARRDSPFSGKHIDAVKIQFSRLGFKPLRISGLDHALKEIEAEATSSSLRKVSDSELEEKAQALLSASKIESSLEEISSLNCPDEAFDKIDVDNSGALDTDEIADALSMAALAATTATTTTDDGNVTEVETIVDESDRLLLKRLASQLVQLYDFNGDGVVDREEYREMVEDMAALRLQKEEMEQQERKKKMEKVQRFSGMKSMAGNLYKNVTRLVGIGTERNNTTREDEEVDKEITGELTGDDALLEAVSKGEGSIVISDMKLDLRRLLFGAIPFIKRITPGGPLVLEPFTVTMSGSFTANDVMDSILLDAGLRQLVRRTIRRRLVFGLRDFLDMAVFYGRTWKLSSQENSPLVDVPKLTKVEFDKRNKMIITGRALVQTTQDSPKVEQAFKVRCKLGTNSKGKTIKLMEPELALVIECPKAIEEGIESVFKTLPLKKIFDYEPKRPEPIYSFFPIYSPFKVDSEDDGFNLGDDNCIKSIFIKDGALRFELSAVLRPGRFLGNHYLAFTVPNRTFIITMDRVREGMRAARKNKLEMKEALKERQKRVYSEKYANVLARALMKKRKDDKESFEEDEERQLTVDDILAEQKAVEKEMGAEEQTPDKNFFSRFVEGYLGAAPSTENDDAKSEHYKNVISDWFSRQSRLYTTSQPASQQNRNRNEAMGSNDKNKIAATALVGIEQGLNEKDEKDNGIAINRSPMG